MMVDLHGNIVGGTVSATNHDGPVRTMVGGFGVVKRVDGAGFAALQRLLGLDEGVPTASLEREGDIVVHRYHICLEWYRSATAMVRASVSRDGKVAWVSSRGGEHCAGDDIDGAERAIRQWGEDGAHA